MSLNSDHHQPPRGQRRPRPPDTPQRAPQAGSDDIFHSSSTGSPLSKRARVFVPSDHPPSPQSAAQRLDMICAEILVHPPAPAPPTAPPPSSVAFEPVEAPQEPDSALEKFSPEIPGIFKLRHLPPDEFIPDDNLIPALETLSEGVLLVAATDLSLVNTKMLANLHIQVRNLARCLATYLPLQSTVPVTRPGPVDCPTTPDRASVPAAALRGQDKCCGYCEGRSR